MNPRRFLPTFLPSCLAVGLVVAAASTAVADDAAPFEALVATPLSEADLQALPQVAPETWQPLAVAVADQTPSAPTARARAYEYSDAYRTRAKIHRYASFATLPLFVAQFVEGQRLFDGTGGSGTRSTHKALAFSIGGLFGVNSVTGVWNLIEGRHDPTHRKRRLFHGLTMLGCDAGFVATGLLAPGDGGSDDRARHRKVAITSMAVASANFVFMLLTNR
jgi:hypothetical protein